MSHSPLLVSLIFAVFQCPLRCHKALHVEHEYIHYTEFIKTKGWQKAFKHVVESVEYAKQVAFI